MKPNSMWGNKVTARFRRFDPDRMIDEDRMLRARVGPAAPCIPVPAARLKAKGLPVYDPRCKYKWLLRRDQESVSALTWLQRRREQQGWRNGAKVTIRQTNGNNAAAIAATAA